MAVLIKSELGLTKLMLERWEPVAAHFEKHILAASPLTKGARNQVVLWGVSQATLKTKDYGSTTFYIAKDGYEDCKDGDHANFVNIWEYPFASLKAIPATVALRLVLAINLTLNTTAEQVFTTLLHEWFAHAVLWSGATDYVRADKAGFAFAWIQAQGHEKRADGEHAAFANWSDKQVDLLVAQLALDKDTSTAIITKLKADRDRYNKETGALK
jgi:hypothetical protein